LLKDQKSYLKALAFIMPLVFSVWMVLLNNFVVEVANFTGEEIGLLQSLREVPGFLAFTVVLVLLIVKEQTLILWSLLTLCLGVAVTGYFPSEIGLYCTTVIMSIGFHYYETISQSLTLQWIKKDEAAHFLGQMISVKACASLIAYAGVWLMMSLLEFEYKTVYLFWGAVGTLFTVAVMLNSPKFPVEHEQNRSLIVRKRYWLYYALTFFSGARRQIFTVFAGFLMVKKFGFSVAEISSLFIINYVFNWAFAAKIGKWISRIGEKRALTIEYIGLMCIFVAYAFVESAALAVVLYIVDHLLFSMAIAIKTYFQKIADPKDMASTAGVSFTINHIAAVVIPALLGIVWLTSPSLVFFIGAGFALCSLCLALIVPIAPSAGHEVAFYKHKQAL